MDMINFTMYFLSIAAETIEILWIYKVFPTIK